MKIKIEFLLVLAVFCGVTCWGQNPVGAPKIETQEIVIKKQIIVNDLENQLKDVPFAAVRAFVSYKLAAWLWKNGKDDTGRAERLAVNTVNELYEKKTETPNVHFVSIRNKTFALLEINAKESAKKLAAKYDISAAELESSFSLLDKKDGEKLATDKILSSLYKNTELDAETTILIDELERRKSPELIRILTAIITLEETSKTKFSSKSLFLIAQNFRSAAVSNDLRIRFYRVVLNKAKNAVQFPDEDVDSTFMLLNLVMNGISSNAPDFSAEASALQAALSSRVSRARNESWEREKRISESPDKLSALISEAEKIEDKLEKNYFYGRAAQLALELERFNVAIDLVEKTIEGEMPKGIPDTFREQWHDQFLREVVSQALKKDAVDSAKYATKKMIDKLSMAEALRRTAVYYSEKQDGISAIDAFDEALKLTINTENRRDKIYTLFNLLKIVQKIDANRISETATATAKAIDAIPGLEVEDRPGTENYEKYVDSIMVTNWNLLSVISELVKENRNEAINFVNRINKKEIKIIGNFVLSVDSLNFEKNSNKVGNKIPRGRAAGY